MQPDDFPGLIIALYRKKACQVFHAREQDNCKIGCSGGANQIPINILCNGYIDHVVNLAGIYIHTSIPSLCLQARFCKVGIPRFVRMPCKLQSSHHDGCGSLISHCPGGPVQEPQALQNWAAGFSHRATHMIMHLLQLLNAGNMPNSSISKQLQSRGVGRAHLVLTGTRPNQLHMPGSCVPLQEHAS